jgi:threonine dehydratase
VFVSPFDDPLVMRGNGGLLAEEVLAEAPATRTLVCPVGGGGLVAGMAGAVAGRGVAVIGVQPEANCAMHDSLARGRALVRYDGGPTMAEGCEGGVAESTFAVCRDRGVMVRLVPEPAIARAVVRAYRSGLLVEPSAAVALAGVAEGVVPAVDGTVVVVSGRNLDEEKLDALLAWAARPTSSPDR